MPTQVVELSGDVSLEDLKSQAHPVVNFIPASDRYALVPDGPAGDEDTDAAVPDAAKRARTT